MPNVILSAKDISKSFFGVGVLKGVDFNAYEGEVHAIVGENGAGKSTLMKILAGVYSLDSGSMQLLGEDIIFRKPSEAIKKGIITIHQELNMCTHLTVLENLFLAREYKTKIGTLNKKRMKEEAQKALKRFKLEDEIEAQVRSLPISKQQVVEIARAVSMSSKVLIMDEPTSSLSSRESKQLFDIIDDLKKSGISIIYISHRLEELERIADRVTILRDGNFIMSKLYRDTNIDEIISAMAGRTITEKYPRIECDVGKTILKVEDMICEPYFRNISFEVKEGEILGLAGLVGSGRSKISKTLAGVFRKQSGNVILDGKNLSYKSIAEAINLGIVYISEDRKQEGLAVKMEIEDNYFMPNAKTFSHHFKINFKKLFNTALELKDKLKIKMISPHDRIQYLSGGNQQKVMIGKWIIRNPRVFIFDEPTRGVDVNSKISIYNTINELKKNGYGIVVVSSELPELLGICDKISVVSNGRITGSLDPKSSTQEEILRLATV